MASFEVLLQQLIAEWQTKGTPYDEMIAALELATMALREEAADDDI